MRPPIIPDENGAISFFASVEAAASYVESVDVRNNEYIAYDSLGYMLKLVPTEPVVRPLTSQTTSRRAGAGRV